MDSKKKIFCPYRTQTITYHNNKNNPYLLPVGPNRKVDYDVQNVYFLPCIKEECALYDPFVHLCRASEETHI